MLTNPEYRAEEASLTAVDRESRRRLEKERRRLLERHRDYQIIDADQHYYEPDDCFTRHLESKYHDQAIEVRRDHPDGRGRVYLGGKRFRHVSGPAGEDVARPGVLREYFKSQGRDLRTDHEGIDGLNVPEFSTKAARLPVLDAYDVEATLMLPSLGLLVENECCREVGPDVWFALMRSF